MKALIARKQDKGYSVALEDLDELPPGDVTVDIAYSSLNYKDALAVTAKGKIIRKFPMVIGIDLAGTVIESTTDEFKPGDRVIGTAQGLGETEWGGYAQRQRVLAKTLVHLPPTLSFEEAMQIGTAGFTAMLCVMALDAYGLVPSEREMVVTGAAGGVGSIAGQIGKILGCRVVGIAGGKEKCRWVVDELGFDDCIDYKAGNVGGALSEACPEGIDVYFDNVGGDILDAALEHMKDFGRIVACGMISGYCEAERPPGPRNIFRIVTKRLRMQGFIVIDFLPRFPEAALQLGVWAAEGKIHNRVHLVEGFLSAPTAINMLFTGENTGKLVVKV